MANRIVTNQAFGMAWDRRLLRPLHDRVFVQRLAQETMRGVLWIPDIAQQNSQRAKVLAVGDQVYGVEPGDIVLLPGVAAKYPDWEQCDMMLIQVGDIGGIFG